MINNVNSIEDFIQWYQKMSDHKAENEIDVWNNMAEMARRAMNDKNFKRPANCDVALWGDAQNILNYAAHFIKKKDTTYVVGFLPFILDLMYGEIESVYSSWDTKGLTKALKMHYDSPLEVFPYLITHDILNSATPTDIHEFLKALVAKKDPEPQWNNGDAFLSEEPSVRIFYLPVLFKLKGDLSPDWTVEDVFIPSETNREEDNLLDNSLFEMFTLRGDNDTRFNIMDVGASYEVLDEAKTSRDLREFTSRMIMLKDAMLNKETSEYEYKVEIQLTWGMSLENTIGEFDVPSIRVSAMAKHINDQYPSVLIYSIHTNKENPQQWTEILAEIMQTSYRLGWYNVLVKQFNGIEALKHWNEYNQIQNQVLN